MKKPPAILGKIAESTFARVSKAKETFSIEQMRDSALEIAASDCAKQKQQQSTLYPLPFEKALSISGLSFICEVKKASPSKGIIAEHFPWLEIAKEYEEGGAAAISVLTEPEFFLGSEQYLREISASVSIPALRKDFIIDPYQLYEAKIWGAKAALLICALLDKDTLNLFLTIAKTLYLDCLVEVHSEEEVKEAVGEGAKIIGINNRDLTTFNVDTGLTARLKKLIPSGILTVAESGINTPDDIREIKETGVDAVLIGESLMRSSDKKQFLNELRLSCL
ncbi:MAG: indole-3-glycerol phosphate synthase TrpC [Treponema sp.]|nr:indole-3-glycerol phosphate synthase TrpC [Treponema sp.]